jgi:hypothetical protein
MFAGPNYADYFFLLVCHGFACMECKCNEY